MTTTGPDLGRRFHALSDEKRLRVLELLRGGERCVCELTEAIDAGQSLLSFHLKTLREAGLVTDRREGRWVYYSLDPAGLEAMRDFLGGLARTAAGDAGGGARWAAASSASRGVGGPERDGRGAATASGGGRRTCC